jgi:RimJ/RimL family protein N-acetyltransferase
MEPVEINAGEHYLRNLRVDDRIDDRVALLDRFGSLAEAGSYISDRAREWDVDENCSWAVCEQLSNTLVAEVVLSFGGELSCWTAPASRGKGIATHAVQAVVGFGFGFLDLERITCRPEGVAAERVAVKSGFAPGGPLGVWTRLR